MGFIIYLVILAISVVLGILMKTISFLPYISYGIFNFVMSIVLRDLGCEINKPFITWAIATAIMCLIHYFGDKYKRLKISFALLSSVGCACLVCIVLVLTPLKDDFIKSVGALVLSSICIIFFFVNRTDVEYDDTNSSFSRIVAILIGIVAFAEYGLVLYSLWESCSGPISVEQRNELTLKCVLGGAVIGCIVSPLLDMIFTKKSRKKIEKRQETANELQNVFDELGQKLKACVILKELTPMQIRILEQNLKEYEELKREINFANATASQAALDKFERVMLTTNDILLNSLDSQEEYEQKTEREEKYNGNQELREALAVFLFDDISEVTLDKLKSQRNKLIKSFHPDGTNEDEKYAQKINAAYELLKNLVK